MIVLSPNTLHPQPSSRATRHVPPATTQMTSAIMRGLPHLPSPQARLLLCGSSELVTLLSLRSGYLILGVSFGYHHKVVRVILSSHDVSVKRDQ